jgi:release factor glutamine methyltransferase
MLSSAYPPEEADYFARLFLEHLFQMPYTRAKMEGQVLSPKHLRQLRTMLKSALAYKPWQYILGEVPFAGLSLEVNEAVLIPRPETEELLGLACKEMDEIYQPKADLSILDIGTGSGCLALGLKQHFPEARVWAVDVSENALEVARSNAARNKLRVHFLQANMLLSPPSDIPPLDIIVSNPPYVLPQDKAAMQQNVLSWEPWDALFAPEADPLYYYKAILDWAGRLLLPDGLIFLEIHEEAGQAMQHLLRARHFENIRVLKDFRGKARFCLARKS